MFPIGQKLDFYLAVDYSLYSDNIGAFMALQDFSRNGMSQSWIEPNQVSSIPVHFGC